MRKEGGRGGFFCIFPPFTIRGEKGGGGSVNPLLISDVSIYLPLLKQERKEEKRRKMRGEGRRS